MVIIVIEIAQLQLINNLIWEFSNQNDNRLNETIYRKTEHNDVIIFQKNIIVNNFYVEDDELEKFLKDYLESKADEIDIITYRSTIKMNKKYGI